MCGNASCSCTTTKLLWLIHISFICLDRSQRIQSEIMSLKSILSPSLFRRGNITSGAKVNLVSRDAKGHCKFLSRAGSSQNDPGILLEVIIYISGSNLTYPVCMGVWKAERNCETAKNFVPLPKQTMKTDYSPPLVLRQQIERKINPPYNPWTEHTMADMEYCTNNVYAFPRCFTDVCIFKI